MGIIIEMDKERKDRTTGGNGVGGRDLEESLMDSVKEDGRLTSGTHAKPKHIPVTDEFLEEYRVGWRVWGAHVHQDHPTAFRLQEI